MFPETIAMTVSAPRAGSQYDCLLGEQVLFNGHLYFLREAHHLDNGGAIFTYEKVAE